MSLLRMLENARRLCAEAGFAISTKLFPAEQVPFADGSFHLVTSESLPITSARRQSSSWKLQGSSSRAGIF
jgi:hypothetical protein